MRRIAARPGLLPRDPQTLRTLADQAFSRAAGAPLVAGNRARILRDATENYPAWEHAIREAVTRIHIEMYIVHRDAVGRQFVNLLAAKARAGVAVRLIYDWMGCGTGPMRGLFTPLIEAGGTVRVFNPPAFGSALGWLKRDHRKVITVDGRVAYVSGLCIGQMWLGQTDRGVEAWRDTGIEIIGPAVANADAAFAENWQLAGGQAADVAPLEAPLAGDVSLRLIPTEPFTSNLFRLDLLIAAIARRSLWITDAYFLGTGAYLEALKRAAKDGVDVRLLLPRNSDVGSIVPFSRSLYRPLIEAGVRIFEWNGTMVHAKTAVADRRWARIGSTNLNINSWIGNWELDVAVEDERMAATLADHYEEDLTRSTEIVLASHRRPLVPRRARQPRVRSYGSSRPLVRGLAGLGRSVGAAVAGSRSLEPFEMSSLLSACVLLVLTAAVAFYTPRLLAWPIGGVAAWIAATLLVEAWKMWRKH